MFNQFFRPSHIDDRLVAVCDLPKARESTSDQRHGVTLYRELGDESFTARDRRLVQFVLGELRELIGNKLADCRDETCRPLSPRLAQVLDLLLSGYTDREIAEECDLAQPTVREYVTAIYRRYGVSSRARLLAKFLRITR